MMDRVDYDLNNYFNDLEYYEIEEQTEMEPETLSDYLNSLYANTYVEPRQKLSREELEEQMEADAKKMDQVNHHLEVLRRIYGIN